MNNTCLSRMYVDVHESKHVVVRYIPTHTGHTPFSDELKFLPLPMSTKDKVAPKLSQGIPSKRILQCRVYTCVSCTPESHKMKGTDWDLYT